MSYEEAPQHFLPFAQKNKTQKETPLKVFLIELTNDIAGRHMALQDIYKMYNIKKKSEGSLNARSTHVSFFCYANISLHITE